MKTRFLGIIGVLLLLLGAGAGWRWGRRSAGGLDSISSETTSQGPIILAGPAMGSTWTIHLLRLPPGVWPDQLQARVQQVIDRVEDQMSTYRPQSNLCQFNRLQSTDWISVPLDLAQTVADAKQISETTAGAFDVTVAPLVNLWGFGPVHPAGPFGTIPSDALIEQARRHVGYRLIDVRLDPAALRKSDPLARIDLSGIAKGYATDLVGKLLESFGIRDYLVALGGEMRARGLSQAGRPWRVGIETPAPGAYRVLYEVELRDLSISTSGDYRNYFDQNGRRYCHEIDPSTGRPAADAPASVSVLRAAGYADAMPTALMVLGAHRGYALARKLNLPALFIVRAGDHFEAHATPQFRQAMVGPAPGLQAR